MSLYNMLHGVNPMTPLLLSFLGITVNDVPRFRDTWIEDGKIAVHTRTGGGNRDWYDSAESYKSETGEDGTGPWNDDLRALSGFLYDEDDDFDCTYATFYFAPQEDVAPLVRQLSELGGEKAAEKWRKLFSDMDARRDSPRVARALEVAGPVIGQIVEALDASAMSAEGQDPQGLGAKPASATGEAGDAQPSSTNPQPRS